MGIILQYISYSLSDLARLWKDGGEWAEGRNLMVAAVTVSLEISWTCCYSFHFYTYLIIYCIILSCRSHFVKGYMSYSSKICGNCHVLEKLKSFALLCYFSCCSRDSWNSFSSEEADVLGLSVELLTLGSNKTRFIRRLSTMVERSMGEKYAVFSASALGGSNLEKVCTLHLGQFHP